MAVFPNEEIRRAQRRFGLICDAWCARLGYKNAAGQATWTEGDRRLVSLAIVETESLRRLLKETAQQLDLEYPEDLQAPQCAPDHPSRSLVLPESRSSDDA